MDRAQCNVIPSSRDSLLIICRKRPVASHEKDLRLVSLFGGY